MKQTDDKGPVGTAFGLLIGSLIGLLAGPVGVAVGASTGTLTGLLFDLGNFGVSVDFVNEVSQLLGPGKTAVLAEMEETWVAPVDTRLNRLGGLVFRRLRSEVMEDQLVHEAAAFDAELKQLEEEWAQANAETKAAVQKAIGDVKKKLAATRDQIESRAQQAKSETDAKVNALRDQVKQARDRQREIIEQRIADVKADYEGRSAKLAQADKLIGEALSP